MIIVFPTITASLSAHTTEMWTIDPAVMATVLNRGCYSVNLNGEYYGLCNNNGKPFSIYDRDPVMATVDILRCGCGSFRKILKDISFVNNQLVFKLKVK